MIAGNNEIKHSNTQIFKEKQVLILYTGGTIGSVKGKNGLSPKHNFLYDYMLNHPNLCDKEYTLSRRAENSNTSHNESVRNCCNIKENMLVTPETLSGRRIFYNVMETEFIIDSADMNLEYWKLMGKTIEKYYNEFDSFIILHGTDTMNYTACVLSFMFENLNKTVIITGSQIPLLEMRNDALKNMIDSLTIAGLYHIPEVTIMFDSKLFRGNRTIKNDNLGLKAFESPNMRPLAQTKINIKVNWDLILPPPTEEFAFFENLESRITVIKMFPIIKDSTFESYFKPFIKAVIIETYGTTKFPKHRPKLISIIEEALKRGVIIINVSQSRKNSGFNAEDEPLETFGILSAVDMTVECCLAKLSYLLGKGYSNQEVKALFKENLRGEMTIFQPELSLHSNKFVNALLTIMNENKKNEENYNLASTLLPTIINELVEKNNYSLLVKLKKIIKLTNFKHFGRKNPLHYAAINGNLQMAKFLLKCQININEIDDCQYTPLNYACIYKNREVAMFLKENGGILNQNNKEMGDLFCYLASHGDLESIKLFYECGANLMVGNYDNRTVAHIAASFGMKEIIEFLLNQTNLNIMIENRWGKTPYEEATEDIKTLIIGKARYEALSKKKKKMLRRKKLIIK